MHSVQTLQHSIVYTVSLPVLVTCRCPQCDIPYIYLLQNLYMGIAIYAPSIALESGKVLVAWHVVINRALNIYWFVSFMNYFTFYCMVFVWAPIYACPCRAYICGI